MRVALPEIDHLKDIKLWISKKLPATLNDGGDVLTFTPDASKLNSENFSDVLFDKAVDITGDTLYLGVTFTQTTISSDNYDNWPMWTYQTNDCVEGGFYLQTSETFSDEWSDVSPFGYGNAAIDAILDISNIKANAKVSANDLGNVTITTGDTANFHESFTSDGYIIKSLDLTVNDGDESKSQSVSFDTPISRIHGTGNFILAYPSAKTPSAKEISYTIDKINGQDNAEQVGNLGEGELITVDKPAPRKTVYESMSSMVIPTEVLAWGSADLLKNAEKDKMIALNAHFSIDDDEQDVYNCDDYIDVAMKLGGGYLPAYVLDRKAGFNPYYGFTSADANGTYHFHGNEAVDQINAMTSEASFNLKAEWADDTKNSIKATTTTTFGYSRDESEYAIAFVLTEDSLTSDGSYMVNALSPNYMDESSYSYPEYDKLFPDADIAKVVNAGDTIWNPLNNDVVRGAWSPLSGIDNSVSSPIVKDQPQTYTTTLDISNKTIADKKNTNLVALLINVSDGSIVNADKVSLDETANGVASIKNNTVERKVDAIYGVDGSRYNSLRRGINIVKYSDGTSVKILK